MAARWRPRPIRVPDVGPMINTTPLIDLMLVLLVMLIVSIPISTHKLPLDLPVGPPGEPAPVHRLDMDVWGQLSLDGRAMSDAEIAPQLARIAADSAQPALHFAVHAEARYERVDEALALIRGAGITRLGLVGNERFLQSLDGGPA